MPGTYCKTQPFKNKFQHKTMIDDHFGPDKIFKLLICNQNNVFKEKRYFCTALADVLFLKRNVNLERLAM